MLRKLHLSTSLFAADVTPPRLQISSPVISNEGITLRWSYDEEAVSLCELQAPSMLTMTTIPCSGNVFLLTNDLKGSSLFIQGMDVAGNVAAQIQLTWNVGKYNKFCDIAAIIRIPFQCLII